MVNKEPNSAHIATKLITSQIQSQQEWEALQSLNVIINFIILLFICLLYSLLLAIQFF